MVRKVGEARGEEDFCIPWSGQRGRDRDRCLVSFLGGEQCAGALESTEVKDALLLSVVNLESRPHHSTNLYFPELIFCVWKKKIRSCNISSSLN